MLRGHKSTPPDTPGYVRIATPSHTNEAPHVDSTTFVKKFTLVINAGQSANLGVDISPK